MKMRETRAVLRAVNIRGGDCRCEFNENWRETGKELGGGGPLYPPQRQLLGGCLQKPPETRAFDFD